MIEIKNLYKSFDTEMILKNINLKIFKNEMVALQGPSGAGKTTLLKSIGLLDNINRGSIKFNQKEIHLFDENEQCLFRNQQIGFIFQFHNLLPEFSVIENICIPYWVYNKNFDSGRKTAEKLMETLNISDKKNKKPQELSGGEQQRVAVARALINSPKLILADEPTGNLDSEKSIEIFELFKNISKKFQTTFLIITHNNRLAKMCDRIIKIKDGKIVKE